jgi:hypothetical protein
MLKANNRPMGKNSQNLVILAVYLGNWDTGTISVGTIHNFGKFNEKYFIYKNYFSDHDLINPVECLPAIWN